MQPTVSGILNHYVAEKSAADRLIIIKWCSTTAFRPCQHYRDWWRMV